MKIKLLQLHVQPRNNSTFREGLLPFFTPSVLRSLCGRSGAALRSLSLATVPLGCGAVLHALSTAPRLERLSTWAGPIPLPDLYTACAPHSADGATARLTVWVPPHIRRLIAATPRLASFSGAVAGSIHALPALLSSLPAHGDVRLLCAHRGTWPAALPPATPSPRPDVDALCAALAANSAVGELVLVGERVGTIHNEAGARALAAALTLPSSSSSQPAAPLVAPRLRRLVIIERSWLYEVSRAAGEALEAACASRAPPVALIVALRDADTECDGETV